MIKKLRIQLEAMQKQIPLWLQIIFIICFIISGLLAIAGLQRGIIFSYDQARDAIQAYNIWHNHHLEILGPSTDIPGIFHGVLWYYLLAFVYGVVRRPEFVAAVFCIFLFLTTPLVALLAQELFKDTQITIISVIFYMLSPLFQTASRWLSNPIPSFLVSPLLLLLWWNFSKRQNAKTAVFIGICYGIIIQAEFGLLLILATIPIYYLLLRIHLKVKECIALCAGLFLSTSTFFIAEVKFHGQAVKGLLMYIRIGTPRHAFWDTLSRIKDRFVDFFTVSFLSFPNLVTVLCIVAVLLVAVFYFRQYRKQLSLLLVWFGFVVVFLLSGTGIATSYFLFFPFLSAFILLGSFAIRKVFRNSIILAMIVLIIAYGQIAKSYQYLASNTSPLPAQQGATLNLEKQIIVYTYEAARRQPFTIITISNPLYINTTWAYLYSEYGLLTYGYVPNYGGRGQTGIFGENLLPEIPFGTKIRYLIFEPTDGLATIYITKITYEEDKVSDIIETKNIGRYVIQKRMLHHNKPLPPVPDELKGKPILYE